MKLKDVCFCKKSYNKPTQHIKSRHHFASKGPYSERYGFSSSHVQMWQFDHKEGWSEVKSLSHVWLFVIPWALPHQASLSITNSRSLPNSCPLSQWCHPATSSSVVPFSSCPQSLPASESFPMSQLFAWGGQSTGVSASASFPPKKSQGWSPLGWTGWISLQSNRLSRVCSNTTVQKHQFFGTQLSL